MGDERGYTVEAQITCVKREIAMRKNVYPKWVQSGRMKAEAADHEINHAYPVFTHENYS